MECMEKLKILGEAAKYDVSCSSSGGTPGRGGSFGSVALPGVCHTWTADGRCISLLKILYSNECVNNCVYCVNRSSAEVRRASFTPEELAELVTAFYRRNYIEGLFLSSGVERSPDYTSERMIRALELLRYQYGFRGYIHAKAIPGTSPELLYRLGLLADRMSVNIELPSEESLVRLAPQKSRHSVLTPMQSISSAIQAYGEERRHSPRAPLFVPAGQSTQLIVGASPERDLQILRLCEHLYGRYGLKRVYYSAFVPVSSNPLLPQLARPPLLREHRLYQADWMLRFYGFKAEEMVSAAYPDLDEELDPKSSWALRHPEFFPLDVNRASYEELLRIPGVGVLSARKIIQARRCRKLDLEHLQKIGVVLRRARYFLDLPPGQGHFSALLSSPEMLRQALLPRKSSREHPGQKRLPLEEPSLLSS